MYAHAIAQVEPPHVGIHLIWTGPHPWVYSQSGWSIQRRDYRRRPARAECNELDGAGIAHLRITRELLWPSGVLTLRDGLWPVPITTAGASDTFLCEVFCLALATPQFRVLARARGKLVFITARHGGKVVYTSSVQSGDITLEINAVAMDSVVIYVLAPELVRFCTYRPVEDEDEAWAGVPYLVEGLQLPLAELMPKLSGPDDEYAEAKSRLLPGEELDPEEFKRLVTTLRAGIKEVGPPRPLDLVLLTREELDADFEESAVVDPLRVLVTHPKWRRVLGFGWFDNDPSLVQGAAYEYRITGHFPAEDLSDRVYGFHTVPSQTLLPAEFFLHDLRVRLAEPATVQRDPDTTNDGFVRVTRRGIPIRPRSSPWWLLHHLQLEDWSLVVDFPAPVTSIILEMHHKHELEWAALISNNLVAAGSVPAGTEVHLVFPQAIEQIRFLGDGFLFAIRVPSGPTGVQPRSLQLPPITLQNTPRPKPPLWATVGNLQQPLPQPAAHSIPPAIPPRRPALGFEIIWRPALRDGLSVWPEDMDSAPPLDAAIFQIEHRQETVASPFVSEVLQNLREEEVTRGRGRAPQTALPPHLIKRIQQLHSLGDLPDTARAELLHAITTGDTERLHALAAADTAWTPVMPEENWIIGDRGEAEAAPRVAQGVNLMDVFPEVPRPSSGTSLDLRWRDVFDFEEGENEIVRPLPPPGTYHRYRVRTIDAIGRPSDDWVETNQMRLEKHLPPPVPAGPDLIPAEERTAPAPTGVQARVLVQGAPGLTADDVALLGTDSNVIVLRWGWHQQQREQDEFATEFRVYATEKPLDVVAGTILSYSIISLGVYTVNIQLARAVVEDAATGLTLDAPYPFQIYGHDAGTSITATIGTRVPKADGTFHEPALGPILFNVQLTPDLTRPPAWAERVEVQPITQESRYVAMLRNRLLLSPDRPRDALWVGVSAADNQSYVADQLAPVGDRPGNESAIVPVLCEARYHGRPDYDVPPALEPVAVIVAPEPAAQNVTFALDLTPHFDSSSFTAGERMLPERVAAGTVFTSYYATPDHRVMAKVIDARNAAESEQEVVIPNPGDRAAIVDALNGPRVDALADHYVVFLAGSHPYRDRLFSATSLNPVPLGTVSETLPPRGERYAYRIRKAAAAGHLSAGGAMVEVVVRVPSLVGGPTPAKIPAQAGDPTTTLRLRIGPDPLVTHLLVFPRVVAEPAANGSQPATGATLLRVPNRPDLYPNDGIRLRTPEGEFLLPIAKALSDGDVANDATGARHIALELTANPGERLQVWACTLTVDGVPSLLAGPFGVTAPPPPLPVPVLSVTPIATTLLFSWSWPVGDGFHDVQKLEVALEQRTNGSQWVRFSPLMAATTTSYTHTPAAGTQEYRLMVRHSSGRSARSAPVSV